MGDNMGTRESFFNFFFERIKEAKKIYWIRFELGNYEIYKEYETEKEWKNAIHEYKQKMRHGAIEEVDEDRIVNFRAVNQMFYGSD